MREGLAAGTGIGAGIIDARIHACAAVERIRSTPPCRVS